MKIDSKMIIGIDKEELSWRKQNLIIPNSILRIKGALLKMEIEKNLLRYENSKLLRNKVSEEDINQNKEKYLKAKDTFDEFIKTHYWYE